MAITVAYTVHPPTGVETPTPTSGSFSFASTPYDSTGLRDAQAKLNETLTVWKDAIGDAEKSKEDPGEVGFGKGKAAQMNQHALADAGESSDED